MNYRDLIDAVYYQPALITPEAHASIRALLEARLGLGNDNTPVPNLRAPGQGMCGEEVPVAQMEVIDHVAHIPIGGAIGQKLTGFERGRGAVDVQDIANELAQCEADRDVKAILLDIDSPGGMVSGTPELAQVLDQVRKPVYAFSNGLMASAAYWLGCTADLVFCSSSANIGSIGVYLPVMDMTGFYESRGVKVELIKAGKLKGIGYPGTTLTESAREHLQTRVNQIYQMFTKQVTSMRGGIAESTMQGQTFLGDEARSLGLVDGIVNDKWAVHRMLK